MARFTGKDSPPNQPEPGLSVVAPGMCVKGDLETNGVVKVEGRIEGSVSAARQVLVSKGGEVDGQIRTREAVIGGSVTGPIFADERIEIQNTARINGDLATKRILLHEGGEVNGELKMTASPTPARQADELSQPKPQEHVPTAAQPG